MLIFPDSEGTCSIVYRPDTLTPEERALGIEVVGLPMPETSEGMYAILKGNKGTGELWYEYKAIPEAESEPVAP